MYLPCLSQKFRVTQLFFSIFPPKWCPWRSYLDPASIWCIDLWREELLPTLRRWDLQTGYFEEVETPIYTYLSPFECPENFKRKTIWFFCANLIYSRLHFLSRSRSKSVNFLENSTRKFYKFSSHATLSPPPICKRQCYNRKMTLEKHPKHSRSCENARGETINSLFVNLYMRREKKILQGQLLCVSWRQDAQWSSVNG